MMTTQPEGTEVPGKQEQKSFKELSNEFIDTHPDFMKTWSLKQRMAFRTLGDNEQIEKFFDNFLRWYCASHSTQPDIAGAVQEKQPVIGCWYYDHNVCGLPHPCPIRDEHDAAIAQQARDEVLDNYAKWDDTHWTTRRINEFKEYLKSTKEPALEE